MSDPNEPVRVSDKRTGHHYTTTQASADADTALTILKQDAVDPRTGAWLPPKYKTGPSGPEQGPEALDQAPEASKENRA